MRRKKPTSKAKKSLTPQKSAQKRPQDALKPAKEAETPAQLPCTGHLQPRSSAQAKAAASAMRRALDKEEAGTPGVRETPAGKPLASHL